MVGPSYVGQKSPAVFGDLSTLEVMDGAAVNPRG
jgi:hypothetical protein